MLFCSEYYRNLLQQFAIKHQTETSLIRTGSSISAQGTEQRAVLVRRQSKAAEARTVYTRCTAHTCFRNIRDWMYCGHGKQMSRISFCRMAQYESDAEKTYFADMSGCDKSRRGNPQVRAAPFPYVSVLV